jgi:hypothetical protein
MRNGEGGVYWMESPVIIDTDVDFDDYLAVLYLLKHPEVEVIGITVTGVGANNYSPLPSPISRISMVLLFSDGPLAKRRI